MNQPPWGLNISQITFLSKSKPKTGYWTNIFQNLEIMFRGRGGYNGFYLYLVACD